MCAERQTWRADIAMDYERSGIRTRLGCLWVGSRPSTAAVWRHWLLQVGGIGKEVQVPKHAEFDRNGKEPLSFSA